MRYALYATHRMVVISEGLTRDEGWGPSVARLNDKEQLEAIEWSSERRWAEEKLLPNPRMIPPVGWYPGKGQEWENLCHVSLRL